MAREKGRQGEYAMNGRPGHAQQADSDAGDESRDVSGVGESGEHRAHDGVGHSLQHQPAEFPVTEKAPRTCLRHDHLELLEG
ncbi:hypothetical protein ACGFNU_37030 [Spirillospora sp. NPDC048911]|uniref:hypothetical protein n=1 Tax=Spirillospora sp. NPDC048911 TaxID=3364527 RepID=UPI003711850A